MKKDNLIQKLGKQAVLPAGLVLAAGMTLVNNTKADVIIGAGPVATIGLPTTVAGQNVTLTTDLSLGIFNGSPYYLYQYQINVIATPAPVTSYTMVTLGLNSGGTLGGAVNAAVAGPIGNPFGTGSGLYAQTGTSLGLVRNVPGGGGGAVPGIALNFGVPFVSPLFGALAPVISTVDGRGGGLFNTYIGPVPIAGFPFPAFSYNINTVPAAGGNNWDMDAYTDLVGDTTLSWFTAPGNPGLVAGQSSPVFDIFSQFGPVAAGAFPDPEDISQVDGGIGDTAGDQSFAQEPDTSTPEPTTMTLIGLSAAGMFAWRRCSRKK